MRLLLLAAVLAAACGGSSEAAPPKQPATSAAPAPPPSAARPPPDDCPVIQAVAIKVAAPVLDNPSARDLEASYTAGAATYREAKVEGEEAKALMKQGADMLQELAGRADKLASDIVAAEQAAKAAKETRDAPNAAWFEIAAACKGRKGADCKKLTAVPPPPPTAEKDLDAPDDYVLRLRGYAADVKRIAIKDAKLRPLVQRLLAACDAWATTVTRVAETSKALEVDGLVVRSKVFLAAMRRLCPEVKGL